MSQDITNSNGSDAKELSRLTPGAYRRHIERSGWRLVDVAYRWGITENYLSRLIADPDRAAHWDDAVRGLPKVSAAELRHFRMHRLANPLPKKPTRAKKKRSLRDFFPDDDTPEEGGGNAHKGYLSIGDIIAVVDDMAKHGLYTGDEGIVLKIDEDDENLSYKIDFEGVVIWLEFDEIRQHCAETGKSRPVPNAGIGKKND